MKKYLPALLALLSLLFSCQVKSKRVYRQEKPPEENSVSSNAGTEPLDTSLTNLSKKRAIGSLQAMAQNWSLDDVDQLHWTFYMWDSVSNKRKFPGISLFPDGRFTLNPRADLKTGTWMVDKEKSLLTLNYSSGGTEIWTVNKISMSKFQLSLVNAAPPLDFKYTSQSIIHNQPEEDPFYPNNNLWRLKPLKPETTEEIKKRIKNFVHFWMLFFKDNHLRHETDISYIGLPSCLVWYNGGIGLQQEFDMDKKWIDCFYSEKQAREAYALLGQVISSKSLKWPEHPTSWVKQLYEVLAQMENKF